MFACNLLIFIHYHNKEYLQSIAKEHIFTVKDFNYIFHFMFSLRYN